MPVAHSRIRLDLNNPEFQQVLFQLETAELKQVVTSLRRLRELEWTEFYRHKGFHWEAIEHLKAPNGARYTHFVRKSARSRFETGSSYASFRSTRTTILTMSDSSSPGWTIVPWNGNSDTNPGGSSPLS